MSRVENQKRYYEKNKERLNQYRKEYYHKHLEESRAYHRYYGNKKRAEMRSKEVFTCPMCGKAFTPQNTLKQVYCSNKCKNRNQYLKRKAKLNGN